MKFMALSMVPVAKAAEVIAASDKVWKERPREGRPESGYLCMTFPFPVPPNTLVSLSIGEYESAEEMAASIYPVILAGATVNMIPLLEVPLGGGAETEKKYRD